MRSFLENRPTVGAKPSPAPPGSASTPGVLSQGIANLLPGTAAPGAVQQVPTDSAEFPKVDLAHDQEGRISEIRIHCRCGEQITLRCIY